ncbi:unnamed protein product [Prorocentrum cordatum]|uniref:Uncharacterized protein n=1 Tax=Prorocentrum cordatum TaxID=2364126 RepID=A0ABN9QTH3_9DINO|nr:unnamed protein product [Polarella glacialis]
MQLTGQEYEEGEGEKWRRRRRRRRRRRTGQPPERQQQGLGRGWTGLAATEGHARASAAESAREREGPGESLQRSTLRGPCQALEGEGLALSQNTKACLQGT